MGIIVISSFFNAVSQKIARLLKMERESPHPLKPVYAQNLIESNISNSQIIQGDSNSINYYSPNNELVSDLRLVDVGISEPNFEQYGFFLKNEPISIAINTDAWTFPVLDVKIRNLGTEVSFLKEAEFQIMKVGVLRNPTTLAYQNIPSSMNYDVLFEENEKEVVRTRISQAIKPNCVDRFTFTIAQSSEELVLPSLYYFQLTIFYDEDNKRLTSNPIVLPVPNVLGWGGGTGFGFNPKLGQENVEIIREFSQLKGLVSCNFRKIVEQVLGSS